MAELSKPLYLKKAYLEGYKTIKGLEVHFEPGLNIIIGKNGSGKTNLFEFLYHTLRLDYEGFLDFNTKIVLKSRKGAIEITANNESFRKVVQNKQFTFEVDADVDFRLAIDSEDVSEIKNRKDVFTYLADSKLSYSQSFIRHGIPLINMPVIDTPFSFNIDRTKINADIYNRIRKVDTPDFIKNLFAAMVFELEFVKHSSPSTLQNSLWDCFGVISILKPYLADNTDIQGIRVNEHMNMFVDNTFEKITVNNFFLEFKINNNWMPFAQLSDGTKRMFYIIAEVAFNQINIFGNKTIIKFGKNTEQAIRLFENRVILFEEPELGVHPHQLQKLLQFIKGQALTKQIIISTHSPMVLDTIGKDELDRIQIATLTNKGTQLRKLTSKEIKKARIYMEETGLLSDYWRFSDLEA